MPVVPPGRPWLVAVAAGLLAALFDLSVITGGSGGMILVYLTPLPLFAAGLGFGTGCGVIAGAVATAVMGAVGGPLLALLFAGWVALPVGILVRQALLWRRAGGDQSGGDQSGGDQSGTDQGEWYSPGRLVLWLTGFAVLGLAGAFLIVGDRDGGLEAVLRRFLEGSLGAILAATEGTEPASGQVSELAARFAPWAPGLVAVGWIVMLAINGVLAQGVLVRFARNMRPSPSIAAISVPVAVPVGFAAAILLAAIGTGVVGFAARNLAMILAVPLFFAGLAVVHGLVGRFTARVQILIGVYLAMLILVWPIAVIVTLGMIEQWVGLRRRFMPSAPPKGEV